MTIFFFPQWQGAGSDSTLDSCANVFRSHMASFAALGSPSFVEIPLDPREPLTLEQGIIGRRLILNQLSRAQALISQTNPERIALLGGDCSVELAPVSFLHKKYGEDFALLWLDAHGDLNTPQSSPSNTFHGMPLRALMGEGDAEIATHIHPLLPRQVYLVAVREFDPPERDFVEKVQIECFPVSNFEVDEERILATLVNRKQTNLYLHIDLDALDPQIFPYCGFLAADGLSVSGLLHLLQHLDRHCNLVGLSLTEFSSENAQVLGALAPLIDFFIRFSNR